jgi:hypothetical protein
MAVVRYVCDEVNSLIFKRGYLSTNMSLGTFNKASLDPSL